jgi:hypothetical protein
MSKGCAGCSRGGRVSRAETVPNLGKTLFFASEFEAFSLFVIVSIKDEVEGKKRRTRKPVVTFSLMEPSLFRPLS